MVTVVVIGIISALAAPSFDRSIDRIKFRSQNKEILSMMRTARSLAISEKVPHGVHFDGNSMVITLFKDSNNPLGSSYEAGQDTLIACDTLSSTFVYLHAALSTSAVVYQPNGSASESGTVLLISADGNSVNSSQLSVLASTGRSRIDNMTYY